MTHLIMQLSSWICLNVSVSVFCFFLGILSKLRNYYLWKILNETKRELPTLSPNFLRNLCLNRFLFLFFGSLSASGEFSRFYL